MGMRKAGQAFPGAGATPPEPVRYESVVPNPKLKLLDQKWLRVEG
jgi:hypothetical protein